MGIDVEEIAKQIRAAILHERVGIPIFNMREGYASTRDGVRIESLHIVMLMGRVEASALANLSAEIEFIVSEQAPNHRLYLNLISKP